MAEKGTKLHFSYCSLILSLKSVTLNESSKVPMLLKHYFRVWIEVVEDHSVQCTYANVTWQYLRKNVVKTLSESVH